MGKGLYISHNLMLNLLKFRVKKLLLLFPVEEGATGDAVQSLGILVSTEILRLSQ